MHAHEALVFASINQHMKFEVPIHRFHRYNWRPIFKRIT